MRRFLILFQTQSIPTSTSRGVSLIEVLIALAIIASFTVSTIAALLVLITIGDEDTQYIKGTHLLEEGTEVVRFLRDDDWSTFSGYSTGQVYYIATSSSGWTLTTTPTYVDEFLRTVEFSSVQRNISDDIVASGGSVDPEILRINYTVSWPYDGATTTIAAETYLGNIFEL